jgi:exonuclease SbcC
MTPEKIYLKGFAGIRDGMGLDEYTLDLSQFPAEAKLIALAGPNGAGKSTLMDNLHPYRLMPSRASSYSPAAFSFYDHLVLPENIKKLTWCHAGQRYRSTLMFRINGKRKSEAYLHAEEGGRWVPVRLADGTVSDGKTETYDACVDTLLGKPEIFFTSAFAAQNRRPLSSYKPAEIKALMVNLLGLEDIRRQGEKASEVARLLRVALEERRRGLRALADPQATIHASREALARCEAAIRALAADKGRQAAALQAAQQGVATLTAARDAAADTERRRKALQASLAQRQDESARAVAQLRQDQGRDVARLRAIEDGVVKAKAAVQRELAQAASARDDAQAILSRRDEILHAQAALPQLMVELGDAHEASEAAQARHAEREAEATALTLARGELARLRQAAGDAALRNEGLKKRFGLTQTVPCRGTDLQGQCRLLSDAHEAQVLMPAADANVAQLREQYDAVRANIAERERTLARLGETAADAGTARKRVEQMESRRRTLDAAVALQQALSQAEARLAECGRVEADCRSRLAEVETRATSDRAEATASVQASKQRIREREDQGKTAIAEIEAELARLPAPFDLAALAAAGGVLRQATARCSAIEAAGAKLMREQGERTRAFEQAQADAEKAESLRAGVERLDAELGWWNLLAKALSKDGVIALCIDDAGPELSRLVNSLLLTCYGPRFTVRIDTQVETAREELREGFDVVVFDADSGQSKSLEMMSGGQRVWVNEALTRAIALYLAQSGGRHFDTLFSDEADGPLDPERKRMFMQMKREVLRLGAYGREYFVSQTLELVQLADAVIDLGQIKGEQRTVIVDNGTPVNYVFQS